MRTAHALLLAMLVLAASAPAAAPQAGGSARDEADALDAGSVRTLEQQLRMAGFNPGRVDGKVDDQTRRAVQEYQRTKGLDVTGLLDLETQASLLSEVKASKGAGAGGPGPAKKPAGGASPSKSK